MIQVVQNSIVAAWRQGRVLWPWALTLLALDLLSALPVGRQVGAAEATLDFMANLLLSLRFFAAHLGQDWRQVVADRLQFGRYVLWYGFMQGLPVALVAAGVALGLPTPVNGVIAIGILYFSLRLTPLLPAIVAWRTWPGIDRVWVPGGALFWRILGLMAAAILWFMVAFGIAMLIGYLTLSVFLSKDAVHHIPSVLRAHPVALALGGGVLSWIMALFGFAFAVQCFWIIAPPSSREAARAGV